MLGNSDKCFSTKFKVYIWRFKFEVGCDTNLEKTILRIGTNNECLKGTDNYDSISLKEKFIFGCFGTANQRSGRN